MNILPLNQIAAALPNAPPIKNVIISILEALGPMRNTSRFMTPIKRPLTNAA